MAGPNDFLEESQVEDYRAAFAHTGFSVNDFELVQQRAKTTGVVYDAMAGEVTVRCKKTGVSKTYRLASGTTWPADFAQDLHRGAFGRPKN